MVEEGVYRERVENYMQFIAFVGDTSRFSLSSMLRSLSSTLEAPQLGRWC